MRAVGYVRVSTAEQVKHGWNLGADRERIEEIAAENEWQLIEIFDDGGLQGDDPDRPDFNRMLDTLDEFDVIIVRSLDRLSRDTFLYALATKAIRDAGVKVQSFGGPVDLESPEGELSANVLAAIARFEKRQIGVRVKQGVRARAQAGHHHGRNPYGYDVGMMINQAEAAVIKRIFTEYVEGISQREIARRLNRDGIRAQRGNWSQGSVSKQLATPAYVGKIRFNGELYDGTHDPIITEDLWEKAQALRRANVPNKRGKNPIANHLLGGGMLRCGRCGGGLYAITRIRPPRADIEAYTCSTRQRLGLDGCDQPTVKRQPIDEAVYRFVVDTALDLEATKQVVIEHSTAKCDGLAALRDQAVRDQATAEARLTRVRRDYQDGKLDPEDWREQRAELTEALTAAGAQVQRLDEQLVDLTAELDQIDVDNALLVALTAIRAEIMGEARRTSGTGVEAFRAALRRLFVGFELVGAGTLGKGGIDGVIWPQTHDLGVGDYVLIPRVRPEALNFDGESWDLHRTTLAGVERYSHTPDLEFHPAQALFAPIRIVEAKQPRRRRLPVGPPTVIEDPVPPRAIQPTTRRAP